MTEGVVIHLSSGSSATQQLLPSYLLLTILKAYNTIKIVEKHSFKNGKEQITWEQLLGGRTKLYRTEVHLNNAEIKEYLQSHNIDLNPYMMDKTILEAMFFDYLNRVIRFQNGKEQITWEQLLGGRTTA